MSAVIPRHPRESGEEAGIRRFGSGCAGLGTGGGKVRDVSKPELVRFADPPARVAGLRFRLPSRMRSTGRRRAAAPGPCG